MGIRILLDTFVSSLISFSTLPLKLLLRSVIIFLPTLIVQHQVHISFSRASMYFRSFLLHRQNTPSWIARIEKTVWELPFELRIVVKFFCVVRAQIRPPCATLSNPPQSPSFFPNFQTNIQWNSFQPVAPFALKRIPPQIPSSSTSQKD